MGQVGLLEARFSLAWRTALAGALVSVLALSGVYVVRHRKSGRSKGRAGLLKNSALAEVERTERDYMKAIDQIGGGGETATGVASDAIAGQLQGKTDGAG